MPIVNGKYEAKISTTFCTTKEGVDAIKGKVEKSKKVRISNVPMGLLEKLLPLLKGKDVKIVLASNENSSEGLKEIGEVAVQKAKIYKDYKGIEANSGAVYFSDRVFNVVWDKNKILQIEAMDYNKCVKCMKGMFEVAWRYAEK